MVGTSGRVDIIARVAIVTRASVHVVDAVATLAVHAASSTAMSRGHADNALTIHVSPRTSAFLRAFLRDACAQGDERDGCCEDVHSARVARCGTTFRQKTTTV